MLLVIFINIIYLCISVYIFREFCMSDCLIYESVHIKFGIDLFTRHKANITQISSKFIKTSHTNISCINCNFVTVLPWVHFQFMSQYLHGHVYCFYPVMGPLPSIQMSRILPIFVTSVMTLDWIANGISL